MTSECFVYLVLPDETEFVTAGRLVREVDQLGRAACRFVYGKSYLGRPNAVPIDPIELKLSTKTYETRSLNGLFGALRDASPDHWGRRIIERQFRTHQPDELDYLLHSPDDRAGALGFGLNQAPPAPRRQFNRTLQLESLQAFADAMIRDEVMPQGPDAEQAQALLDGGTSMGGARPKAVVEAEDALWVAKFNRTDDKWNHARVERAMLQLARECGIQAAESRLTIAGDRDVLLVRRFDRERSGSAYRRARMLSALTLLRAEDSRQGLAKWSYVRLAEELRRISAEPRTDAHELFRRMCFNALISNTDDHPRNHAVIALGEDWRLSPAYDLVPSMPISLERRDLALECGDGGRFANAANLLTQASRFLLEPGQGRAIIDEMEQIVNHRWHDLARREGVSEKDCLAIRSAFAYPGFRLR